MGSRFAVHGSRGLLRAVGASRSFGGRLDPLGAHGLLPRVPRQTLGPRRRQRRRVGGGRRMWVQLGLLQHKNSEHVLESLACVRHRGLRMCPANRCSLPREPTSVRESRAAGAQRLLRSYFLFVSILDEPSSGIWNARNMNMRRLPLTHQVRCDIRNRQAPFIMQSRGHLINSPTANILRMP